ncbi:MAG: NAD-glutamate dehydrogenase [Oceanicoccus sp.]
MVSYQGVDRLVSQLRAEIVDRLPRENAVAVAQFAEEFYKGYSREDFSGRELPDIYGATLGCWEFIQQQDTFLSNVTVFNPEFQKHGWQLGRTVILIATRNMPFITDSVRGELNRRNLTIHTIHSTVFSAVRNSHHNLQEFLPAKSTVKIPEGCHLSDEVLMYLEIGRCTDVQQLEEISTTIGQVLAEVAAVVDDFPAMKQMAHRVVAEVDDSPVSAAMPGEDIQEFLQWLADGHFTFLGYEELAVTYTDNNDALVSQVEGSELGLLKRRPSFGALELKTSIAETKSLEELSDQAILFAKSSVRSRVHRLVYPDYVMLRKFDEQGRIIGKHRFMGLYTSRVYTLTPTSIPLLRQKINHVLERSGLSADSHEGKELARVLDVFPRDELFQSSLAKLTATTMAVNRIQERRQVRLFVRYDIYRKFVNCLVYTPRDVYCTELRVKIERLLCESLGAEESEFTTYYSDSVLVRTHFVLRVDPYHTINASAKDLQEEIIQVTMSWKEHLGKYLVEEFGEEHGMQLYQSYGDAFNPGYMDDFEPRAAIDDIRKIASLVDDDDIAMSFYRRKGGGDDALKFRLFHLNTPLALSDVMPILENLGLRVESEHPYGVKRRDGQIIWVHEFGLTFSLGTGVDFDIIGDVFQEAFLRIWNGDAESDSFNRLILGAQLGWREIAMLRAYSRYMKQIQFNFSGKYIAEALSKHLLLTNQIVSYFVECFQPNSHVGSDKHQQSIAVMKETIVSGLDAVENLSEDRIIRQYLALIDATLRTNYFQTNEEGTFKNYFSFKLAPTEIPDMPLPVPMFEIFVYSPRVEGVHLRGGKVARGGLRWSDRHEDFRTEVLGLVKAQQVKNSVIVPMGAKGGFVARRMPDGASRDEIQAEGVSCYKIFIQALLDITDNLQDGAVVPPIDVVRRDEDDTYLVVAADKGTATFSDIANELAIKAGFWLGDAFASGGSAGYDHKKMGITAKGAWVSVQRHFREQGVNIQETDFTVVGIGDMGGDVFGNGMLLSEHIQLVCAFNHMHIFIDPNPDSASSFIERKRLFELPRSSWEDYDATLISEGGGLFSRSAKSIDLSEQMKQRFSIDADRLTPTALIHEILKAPVDLLWNGGIGTYVKSSQETHAQAGDKANDSLRVDARELRCKVIGEGGNLGITQLSRVEFALQGGSTNTDFIDNAAGVDCSDHEVNIKILLNGVVATDDLTEKQRNQLLEAMTESVSELVLENNYKQTQAISLAEREAMMRDGEYRRLIQAMESSGKLNRELEFIPGEEALAERRSIGKGLTRPELSVLISYVKSQLKEELANSTVPDDKFLSKSVETAFPQRLRDDFNELIHDHRLRREIIATQLANDMVNHMGITFTDRIAQSTGVASSDVVRAYVTASEVFDLPCFWAQIEDLDYLVSADVQMELMTELIRLIRRATRWFIRNRRGVIDPATEIENFKSAVNQLRQQLPAILARDGEEAGSELYQRYRDMGVPEELAAYVSSVRELYPFLSIIEAAQSMEAPVEKVAEMFFTLSERLELGWFAQQISELKIDNYWQAMARETYRDDLEGQLRTLTEGAMRHICEKGDVLACIDRWMEQQQLLVNRWQSMLVELHASEANEFAMYSVAIRELLDLAQSSKYGDVV